MADNVFSEGVRDNPDAGLPNILDLVSRAATLVQQDLPGFLIAGLLPAVLVIGLTVGAVLLLYGSLLVGMLPGMLGEQEDVAALGAVALTMVAMFGMIAALVAVSTPLWASLYRAVWGFLVRGEKLSITSAFSSMGEGLGAQYAYVLLSGAIVLVGLSFCYLPGLIAQGMLVFAWPAVVIHRMPVGRAISWSFGHAMAHPAWHVGLWAVNLVMGMVFPYIPLVGYLLLFTVQPLFVLLAYRAVAGDGEEIRDLP